MNETLIPTLAQADLVQLMANLFASPDEELRGSLQAARDQLPALLDGAGLGDRQVLVRGVLETVDLALSTPLTEWLHEHTRLFECSVACPLNEGAYIRRDKGALLADIAGFYHAFGLAAGASSERPDHIVSELEFVSLLLVMLANAEAQGSEEPAAVTREALAAFAHDHLGEWLGGLCVRLGETTHLPLFTSLAALLAEVWGAICELHALPVSTGKVLICAPEKGTPYECGRADAGLA